MNKALLLIVIACTGFVIDGHNDFKSLSPQDREAELQKTQELYVAMLIPPAAAVAIKKLNQEY